MVNSVGFAVFYDLHII